MRRLAIFACAFAALLPVVSAHGDSTDPATVGQWGPVMQWPLVAVHANLLSSGQVLVWDGFEAGPNSERLFDPNTLALTPRPYARNLFCSGYAQLADGKLFIAGGHVTVNNGLKDATLWDPTTNTAQRLPDLAELALVPDGDNPRRRARRWSFPATTSRPTTRRQATRSRSSHTRCPRSTTRIRTAIPS